MQPPLLLQVYEAEEIGFVCPVYCFIPPAIVQDFIARSTFKADYFFTVGTYGAHSTIFPEFVDKFAKEHGVQMNYISSPLTVVRTIFRRSLKRTV